VVKVEIIGPLALAKAQMSSERFKRIDFLPGKDSLPGRRDGGFVYVFFWVADGRDNPF
jgi:hypothetical protein